MDRQQELYADAVDPLDIAVELERSGIGPETAAHFRHADVFSLAEELHARVPRRAAASPRDEGAWRRRARPAASAGAALAAAALLLWGLRTLGLPVPPVAQAAVFAAAVVPTVGRGLRLPERAALAVGVGGLLALAQGAGPTQLALAAGVGPAEWCARWYRHLGWGHVRSRSSREFRSRMRPVLPTVVLLHVAVLAGLTASTLALPDDGGRGVLDHAVWASHGALWTAQCTTGATLLITLMLRHAGRTFLALAVLAASCGCTAVARALPAHPGLIAWACALAACLLLPCAWLSLLNPTAHRPPAAPHEVGEPGP